MWDWVSQAVENLGHTVVRVHHVDDFAAADEVCDVMLFEHRDCGIGWRHVRDRHPHKKSVWAQWHWDLIAQFPGPLSETHYMKSFAGGMRQFDMNYVKERSMIAEFESLGIKAEYMDQGCTSDWPACQHFDRPEWDVLVFGQHNCWYQARVLAATRLIEAGFTVAWASTYENLPKGVRHLPWCHPNELPELMSLARCVLDIDMRMDVDGYWSDRHWMIRGAGAINLRPGKFGLDDVVEQARLVRDMSTEERERHGMEDRHHVMESHTYEHRLRDILNSLSRTDAWKEKGLPRLWRKAAGKSSRSARKRS